MLNMDMIGRMRKDMLEVGGMKTGAGFEPLVQRLGEPLPPSRFPAFLALVIAVGAALLVRQQAPTAGPQQVPPAEAIAPLVRGACSIKDAAVEGAWRRLILEFRANDAILNFVNGKDVARYSQEGVITPDTTIRIKNRPLPSRKD